MFKFAILEIAPNKKERKKDMERDNNISKYSVNAVMG